MGAPGALIPAEVPSSQLQNYSFAVRGVADIVEVPNNTHLMLDDGSRMLALSSDLERVSIVGNTHSEELLNFGSQTKPDERNCVGINETDRFEHDLGNLLQSLHKSHESSSHTKASPAEKMQVKNVSKYVLSAAKNPEFAQKLHTVLLESGALPPPDLFSHLNTQDTGEDKVIGNFPQVCEKIVENSVQAGNDRLLSSYERSVEPPEGMCSTSDNTRKGSVTDCNGVKELEQIDALTVDSALVNPQQMHEEQFIESSLPKAALSCKRQIGGAFNNIELDKDSAVHLNETANRDLILYDGKCEIVNAVLGEGIEWEIQWEDLHVGERIGIGKFSHYCFILVFRCIFHCCKCYVPIFINLTLLS